MTKTQWHDLCAHTQMQQHCKKKRHLNVFPPPPTTTLSGAFSLPLSDREERRVSFCSHSVSLSSCLPISPSHFSVGPVCLSLSRRHTVLSILSRREYQHVKAGPSLGARWMSPLTATLLCLIRSRLNTKKRTEGISVAQNTRHSHAPWRRHAVVPAIQTPVIFLWTHCASSHRRGHPPMHQHIYSTMATHTCPFFRGKWALNAALDLEADLRL